MGAVAANCCGNESRGGPLSSAATMDNVTAVATDGVAVGVFTYTSSPTMNNVTATGVAGAFNYGVFTDSSLVTIRDSFITGSTRSISMTGGKVVVFDTKLSGATDGGVTCSNAITTALLPFACN